MVSLNKRTSMALFSDPTDHYCQRVRIVLEEKGISSDIIDTDKNNINAVWHRKTTYMFILIYNKRPTLYFIPLQIFYGFAQ